MATRESEILSGVAFLKHPNVQESPMSQRLAFLEQKGLSEQEVAEALKRVSMGDKTEDGALDAANDAFSPSPGSSAPAGGFSDRKILAPVQRSAPASGFSDREIVAPVQKSNAVDYIGAAAAAVVCFGAGWIAQGRRSEAALVEPASEPVESPLEREVAQMVVLVKQQQQGLDRIVTVLDRQSAEMSRLTTELAKNKGATATADKETVNASEKQVEELTTEAALKQVEELVEANTVAKLKNGMPTVLMYISNLVRDPKNPRFKKIATANAKFKDNVRGLEGAVKLLKMVGFVDKGVCLEFTATTNVSESTPLKVLIDTMKDVAAQLRALKEYDVIAGKKPIVKSAMTSSPKGGGVVSEKGTSVAVASDEGASVAAASEKGASVIIAAEETGASVTEGGSATDSAEKHPALNVSHRGINEASFAQTTTLGRVSSPNHETGGIQRQTAPTPPPAAQTNMDPSQEEARLLSLARERATAERARAEEATRNGIATQSEARIEGTESGDSANQRAEAKKTGDTSDTVGFQEVMRLVGEGKAAALPGIKDIPQNVSKLAPSQSQGASPLKPWENQQPLAPPPLPPTVVVSGSPRHDIASEKEEKDSPEHPTTTTTTVTAQHAGTASLALSQLVREEEEQPTAAFT